MDKIWARSTMYRTIHSATAEKRRISSVDYGINMQLCDVCANGFHYFLPNGEHVHPLPATREYELGVIFQNTINAANTAAGSGLHDADCWASYS